jgi:hypothetical protein
MQSGSMPLEKRKKREAQRPKKMGRRAWENNNPPTVSTDAIREQYLADWEKGGPGYPSRICERVGWMRPSQNNNTNELVGDVSRLHRRLGISVEGKRDDGRGAQGRLIRESTAKQIVLAMGYYPVDFDF